MTLDQVAVRGSRRRLPITITARCLRTPSRTRVSISRAGTRALLPVSALQFCKIARDTIAHAELVRMRRADAVAAVIEQATRQNGGRARKADLLGDGVGGASG